MRKNIEDRKVLLHPFVKGNIDKWEKTLSTKYGVFGHHSFSSAVSVGSVAELSPA